MHLKITNLANRESDGPSIVTHEERKGDRRLRCRVLSVRHIREAGDGIELIGHEDYWKGSRLYVGIDKDGLPIWAASAVDSGEGTMLLSRWMTKRNIEATEFYDAAQFLDGFITMTATRARRHTARLLKDLLTNLTLEQKTVINTYLPGTYRGRELFG